MGAANNKRFCHVGLLALSEGKWGGIGRWKRTRDPAFQVFGLNSWIKCAGKGEVEGKLVEVNQRNY